MSEILSEIEDVEGYAEALHDLFVRVAEALELGDVAGASALLADYGNVADDVDTLSRSLSRIAYLSDPDARFDTDSRV